MAINLSKGQKIDLTKTNPGLSKIKVGLGWDTNKYDGGKDFDLDVSVFLTNANGKVDKETNFIFFNNKQNENGSVVHAGDNRTGEGEGDDEVIDIDLKNIPADVEKVAFTITIYEAEQRSQNFGQVSRSYVRIVNEESNVELIRFDLGEDFSIETGVVVGELYRNAGEWKFSAIGSGYKDGLAGLTRDYGLQ
ncbi:MULTISPECIES: TerD family protein [unclassified Paenibacillus]|uniref:TerD family protein n=1 Tax=unclassified Paenibacillus TaxID=185978 RepID=UPI002405B109|nr:MULTISPECIES: TerD family protein [unclassified Paenibacillus]MDF9840888.1 tellurium resistance protein TerD [Paenibacillus sp. PastF-2]MDF9847472.1 tellurium resistance protein TerD [Paenibacillus sp. PastM-2]MDF9853951.1 tellurium resistance protein TerD [Paenibacillus sp. PastF-1]MDH6479223.1 tellurium resistance protein TerD [Paenibacillus sp. PastH-2]MDH6507041.1 tellurium resistance protein TerD [Paenibacillus sp. PastM-3]